MRRALLLVTGALTLALAVPSVAGAHGRHHRHHHHRHHHHKAHGADLSGQAAGTIASYEDGVLTLTLANGSTVSGAVTDETEIGCVIAPPTEPGPTATTAHHGDDDRGDHRRCGDQVDCDASDLAAGATVWKAKLDLGPDGAVLERVILLKQAQ